MIPARVEPSFYRLQRRSCQSLRKSRRGVFEITTHRRVRNGLMISVQCPDTVVLYNQTMAGVDKGDQYQQDYCVETKSCKVYKYIFCFFLDVSTTNSYNILSLFVPTTMSPSHQHLKTFCLWVAEQLVANYSSCPSSRLVTHSASVLPPQQVTMTQCTCTACICHPNWRSHCSVCTLHTTVTLPHVPGFCGTARTVWAGHHSALLGVTTAQIVLGCGITHYCNTFMFISHSCCPPPPYSMLRSFPCIPIPFPFPRTSKFS